MGNKIASELQNIATQFAQIIVTEQEEIVMALKNALDDQIIAAYQYWAAKNMTRGKGKVDADPQFEQHYQEELGHAELLIERIKQLGGFPSPTMADVVKNVKSHALFGAPAHDVQTLLNFTIEAEKEAIETYKKIIDISKNIDPSTHRLAKQILSDEEQHLYDLTVLKEDIC